jgi:hypothetical protein
MPKRRDRCAIRSARTEISGIGWDFSPAKARIYGDDDAGGIAAKSMTPLDRLTTWPSPVRPATEAAMNAPATPQAPGDPWTEVLEPPRRLYAVFVHGITSMIVRIPG